MDVTIGWARPSSTAAGIRLLDAEERARANTFLRTADRYRFIAQHALLRLVVGDLTGDDPGQLELGWLCPICSSHDHGRPVLHTDASVRLSASRSGQRVVVAVAHGDALIGIDVESIENTRSDRVSFDTVAFDRVALTPGEHARIMARPETEQATARTATWVAKEAVLKLAGIGLTVSAAEFDVAASGDVLTEVDVGQDYCCVLATSEPARVTVVDATARLADWATQV